MGGSGRVGAKLVQEELIKTSPVPYTILRSTQFFELMDMLEFAGPKLFRLDEIVRRLRQTRREPGEVVTDPHARYFGAELSEDTLTPDEGAIIGATRFEDWLRSPLH